MLEVVKAKKDSNGNPLLKGSYSFQVGVDALPTKLKKEIKKK